MHKPGPEAFAAAIRYMQERALLVAMLVTFLAVGLSFWSYGRHSALVDSQSAEIQRLRDEFQVLQVTVFQLQAGQCPINNDKGENE